MKKILSSITVLASFIICAVVYAGIGLDPTMAEISVGPNAKYESVWKVSNTGGNTASVKIGIENWFQKEIPPEKWINFETKEFKLEPEQVKELKFTITVPEGAAGEFAAMIFFNMLEEGEMIGSGFGVPIYVMVKGSEIVDAEIIELKVESNLGGGINGYVTIKNNGNVHIRPRTSVQILDNEGKAVISLEVPYSLPVQAGKQRKYDFEQKYIRLSPGKYKILAQSEYGTLYNLDKKIEKEGEMVVEEVVSTESSSVESSSQETQTVTRD